MKSIVVGSGLSVPAFAVPTNDPYYWLLRACYEEVVAADRKYVAGITENFCEQSDFEAAETKFDNLSDYLKSWLPTAMAAAVAGEAIPEIQESYIPELIEFIELAISGNWGLIFVLFVKVGLKFLLERLKERIGEGNIDDVAGSIEKIFLDKSDPENVVNRLDTLSQLVVITPESVVIDCLDWDYFKEVEE